MQTFSRLLSVVTLVLSLGFLAHALPVPATRNALATRQYGTSESYGNDNNYGGNSYGKSKSGSEYGNGGEYGSQSGNTIDVFELLTGLKEDIDPFLSLLATTTSVDDAKIQVAQIVTKVKACAAALNGGVVQVEADMKHNIATLFIEIFVAIVTVCASVSVKLGVSVCLSLWAQIDVCLHLLLLTLNVCVGGLLQVIVGLCANLDATVLANLKFIHLDLCIKIVALVGKIASIAN